MRAVPWPEPDPVVAAAIRVKYAGRRVPLAVEVRDRLGSGWLMRCSRRRSVRVARES